MLWGNHNNPHQKNVYRPMVEKILKPLDLAGHYTLYPVQYRNAKFLGDYYEVAVDGQMIVLFHYPISIWNEIQNGAWHLCGHSHYHFAPSTAEDSTSKILDVGWDGHKKPWSFDEIKEVMATKKVPVVDHHV
jgi:calcineurin-like phosphoesterase family protein